MFSGIFQSISLFLNVFAWYNFWFIKWSKWWMTSFKLGFSIKFRWRSWTYCWLFQLRILFSKPLYWIFVLGIVTTLGTEWVMEESFFDIFLVLFIYQKWHCYSSAQQNQNFPDTTNLHMNIQRVASFCLFCFSQSICMLFFQKMFKLSSL